MITEDLKGEGRESHAFGESVNSGTAARIHGSLWGPRAISGPLRFAFAVPIALALLVGAAHAEGPRTVSGLKNPESAAVGADGIMYIASQVL